MTIKRGDIIELGPHRLMCGDSTNKNDMKRLFNGKLTDVVFCSPPYLDQRVYDTTLGNWTRSMSSAFANIPASVDCQIFVNLGLAHRNGQCVSYWDNWLSIMNARGWRTFGWYVWDKLEAMPGDYRGRLATSHEFVFHLNKIPRKPFKFIPCKIVGDKRQRATTRRDPRGFRETRGPRVTQPCKIQDSVIRERTDKSSDRRMHPALGSIGLAARILDSYALLNSIIFDPFAGASTTFLAANETYSQCLGMEISPAYCQIAVDRYRRHKEKMGKLAGQT